MSATDAIESLNSDLAAFAQTLQVSQRVLVVDDEPTIRVVISEYLASKNILADVVSTGEEGLEMLNQNDYGVLLVDKNLPGVSGMAVMKEAKESHPDMEVVVITGYASVESALEAIKQGAFDYIPKPLPSLEYLHKKVLGALARHDFEVRIFAVIAFLIKTCKSMLANLDSEERVEWVEKLENVLSTSPDSDAQPVKVLLYGSKTLAKSVEKLGYQATTALDFPTVLKLAGEQDFRVMILSDDEHRIDAGDIIRKFHESYRDVGVFVIAREGNLDAIVSAIGVGVGDYMVRPLEGRDFLGPRLERLIKRQQRIVRYRRVLESLKSMNIVLQTSMPGTE